LYFSLILFPPKTEKNNTFAKNSVRFRSLSKYGEIPV
jgi:hypothetical protein